MILKIEIDLDHDRFMDLNQEEEAYFIAREMVDNLLKDFPTTKEGYEMSSAGDGIPFATMTLED